MDKQNVTLKTHQLEVIGQGPMVHEPCQIGEWWVMPADQYTGTIPPEIIEKWNAFKALHPEVIGYLIADDVRDARVKWEKEIGEREERTKAQLIARQEELAAIERQRRKEMADSIGKGLLAVAKVVGVVLFATVAIVFGLARVLVPLALAIPAALMFDPMIVAVMPDGTWVAVAAWWN